MIYNAVSKNDISEKKSEQRCQKMAFHLVFANLAPHFWIPIEGKLQNIQPKNIFCITKVIISIGKSFLDNNKFILFKHVTI